jgi:hypothetical protein
MKGDSGLLSTDLFVLIPTPFEVWDVKGATRCCAQVLPLPKLKKR